MSKGPVVVDANVLIEAKRRLYCFDFCPGFWDFLEEEITTGSVIITTHVYDELKSGKDELYDWLKKHSPRKKCYNCFQHINVVNNHNEIEQYVIDYYLPTVAPRFIEKGVADPWLIACAKELDGSVLTFEASNNNAPNGKVSLVDVCDHFGVDVVRLQWFLRNEKAYFVYIPQARPR